MRNKDFKKLIKEYSPENIIYKHISWNIYLTDKQLDKVIKIKNKKGMRKRCLK